MSDQGSSNLAEWIVRNEIEGKNLAIHAYDGILWKIRTGYLTLHFSSWAVIVTAVEKDPSRKALWPSAVALLAISLGLAVAGHAIDRNYVKRKFRVIRSVDLLSVSAFEGAAAEKGGGAARIDPEDLKVAGDSGSQEFEGRGYEEAIGVTHQLYSIPWIFTAGGVVLGLFLLTRS